MRNLLALVAAAALAVGGLFVTGHLPTGPAVQDTGATPKASLGTSATGLLDAPDGKSVGVCIDPTTSTDKAFAQSILTTTTAAVEHYLPTKSHETKAGVPGVPGLDLTIRLVSTRPLAYGQPYVNIQIPPVPGLPSRPDMTAPGALDPGGPYLDWKKSEQRWSVEYDVAAKATATAVKQLREVDLSNPSYSGVRECVAAVVSVPPKYADATLVVASDLEDNSYTGATPKFDAKPIILIQPCPDGDAKKCSRLKDDFTAWAGASGAGTTTTARAEDAPNTLSRLFTIAK